MGQKIARKWNVEPTVTREFERSEGVLDANIGGKFEPICQELTWKGKGTMTRLVFKLVEKLRCALPGKMTTDEQATGGRIGLTTSNCVG